MNTNTNWNREYYSALVKSGEEFLESIRRLRRRQKNLQKLFIKKNRHYAQEKAKTREIELSTMIKDIEKHIMALRRRTK